MKKVYHVCFDMDELPPHVPRSHPPREHKNYSVNRTLAEMGINETELRSRLAAYIAWCEGDDKDVFVDQGMAPNEKGSANVQALNEHLTT